MFSFGSTNVKKEIVSKYLIDRAGNYICNPAGDKIKIKSR